jgi:hypothetical protein
VAVLREVALVPPQDSALVVVLSAWLPQGFGCLLSSMG